MAAEKLTTFLLFECFFFQKIILIGFFLLHSTAAGIFFFIILGCLFVNLIILDLCTSAAGHFLEGFNFFCKLYSSARLFIFKLS